MADDYRVWQVGLDAPVLLGYVRAPDYRDACCIARALFHGSVEVYLPPRADGRSDRIDPGVGRGGVTVFDPAAPLGSSCGRPS